ncbi:DNA ligase [Vibrio sp. ZSDZ34]|uniref:DNA ligase n=1 Tax=Vibrio gelatinilyticus TaxID=2893468 RepID=A0A9X2AV92_9VIBR|nr:DNA ligase [Vibrio gelatinilyticus]MCJ2376659.1 DNA ligase [Vibrio gelatinilyticus]
MDSTTRTKFMTLPVLSLVMCVNQSIAYEYVYPAPSIVNATHYHQGLMVGDYLVSEKLDGVRAIWTGSQLVTRSGRVVAVPSWFSENLPSVMLEGELWAGRDGFSMVQRTVLDGKPDEQAWRHISFMLFDAPGHLGSFKLRHQFLLNLCESLEVEHIQCLKQYHFATHEKLQQHLRQVTEQGGEGLMLKSIKSPYHPGRNDTLVKMKVAQDAEGVVVGYKAGKGKHHGKMGAILVEIEEGIRFYIGSGFNEDERKLPPKIGEVITFRHNGWTINGIPKFARYHRVRTVE